MGYCIAIVAPLGMEKHADHCILFDELKIARVGLDNTRRFPSQGSRSFIASYPMDSKRHTLAHDIEQAREHQKEPFEFAISQEGGSREQKHYNGTKWHPLVLSLTGVWLLCPACILTMSNYAITRGLLQGCGRLEVLPLGVS
jgi:hypothetical protein